MALKQLKISRTITQRDCSSLDKYLQDINKEKLLTIEEEIELAERIKKGDHEALKELTSANLKFVVSVAKQYQYQGLSLSDLINEGNIGLIRAAEKFDETKGFKFISYAVWWIRQSIMMAIAEQSRAIRLPINQIASIRKMLKIFSKFEQEHRRKPSLAELVDLMDEPRHKVLNILNSIDRQRSLDAPYYDSEEKTMLDVIKDPDSPKADETLLQESLHKDINRVMSTLTVKEKEIIKLYFGLGVEEKSMIEIANKMNLTRERARQIKEKAIKRLRHSRKCEILIKYL